MAFASSDYNDIDHPTDRSLFGTCAITFLFLVVSLVLFGPFIVLLVSAMIVAFIIRFFINVVFCDFCNSGTNIVNNKYYSPDTLLASEESRWLESNSMIIILMVIGHEIDISKLQSIISSRLILVRKNEIPPNMNSSQFHRGQTTDANVRHEISNELLYPKFSQKMYLSNTGWKWTYDQNFSIENHIHNWKESVPISILTISENLSDLLSHINNVAMIPDHPPWDAYLISMTENSLKNNTYPQEYNKQCQENNSNKSLLVFRIHPSLSDGVSLVHILCASLSDEQCPIKLKDRFHSSWNFLNSLRALFIGPLVFIQKWLFTRRDYNIFHPLKCTVKSTSNNSSAKVSFDFSNTKVYKERKDCKNENDQDTCLSLTSKNTSEERLFYFCTYPLSTVSRIKSVTRSTITEIFLTVVTGALRTYQQQISKVKHPYDLLCLLPTDMTKEHHDSNIVLNNSSMTSKTSNQSNMTDISQHITNNYSLVDFDLPTNTEGIIPRLWEVKQRIEELKNSADSIILCGIARILRILFPENFGRQIMKTFYNKNSLSITSLQGPNYNITIGGQKVYNIVYWFPLFCDVSLSISCFSYGDSFNCSVNGDSTNISKIELILDAVVYQLDLLNKLLENRRIPGERKSQRGATSLCDEQKVTMRLSKFDTKEREIINRSLSSSIRTDHICTRLSNIQNQLQNDKNLNEEDLESLRSDFSTLMTILRRRKSCGIDTNDKMVDFNEYIEEISDSMSVKRRSSLQSLVLSSNMRRSFATSLTRPRSTGHRLRSNSKSDIYSSNYLVSSSRSSSQRSSLRFFDEIETGISSDGFIIKMENKCTKYIKSKTIIEKTIDLSDNPNIGTRNKFNLFTVSSQSITQTNNESEIPKRCREDMV